MELSGSSHEMGMELEMKPRRKALHSRRSPGQLPMGTRNGLNDVKPGRASFKSQRKKKQKQKTRGSLKGWILYL